MTRWLGPDVPLSPDGRVARRRTILITPPRQPLILPIHELRRRRTRRKKRKKKNRLELLVVPGKSRPPQLLRGRSPSWSSRVTKPRRLLPVLLLLLLLLLLMLLPRQRPHLQLLLLKLQLLLRPLLQLLLPIPVLPHRLLSLLLKLHLRHPTS